MVDTSRQAPGRIPILEKIGVRQVINAGGTPYSALHDIDANKPGGSIKIRVKTYSHKLGLVEEELRDASAAHRELHRRIEEKRRELIERRRQETA